MSARLRVRVVHALLAGLCAAGCASAPGSYSPGSYSDDEQARLAEYDRAAERVLRSRDVPGPWPAVRVGWDGALWEQGKPPAYYTTRTGLADLGRPGVIVVNRRVLADDFVAEAVLSQELAHYILKHAGEGRCRERPQECDIEARVTSVELLMTGWDLSYEDAVRLQYAYLKSVVRRHGGACPELLGFAARFELSTTCE
jgi:hypothetical protein